MASLKLVQTHTVESLKELMAGHLGRVDHNRRSSSLYAPGIPQGALIEVSGSAQTAFVLSVLSEHGSSKVLWLENDFQLFPPHLKQLGLDLARFAFVETGTEAFPLLRKALRSQVFDFVISGSAFEDERIYKALRLLAEKSNSTVFLLCREHRSHWAIAVQLQSKWNAETGEVQVGAMRDKATGA